MHLLIFRTEVKHGDGYATTRQVTLAQTADKTYSVGVQAWTRGPRGGVASGIGVGFSFEELDRITATAEQLKHGLAIGQYTVFDEVNSVIRCTWCEENIYAQHLLEHRQTAKHQQQLGVQQ